MCPSPTALTAFDALLYNTSRCVSLLRCTQECVIKLVPGFRPVHRPIGDASNYYLQDGTSRGGALNILWCWAETRDIIEYVLYRYLAGACGAERFFWTQFRFWSRNSVHRLGTHNTRSIPQNSCTIAATWNKRFPSSLLKAVHSSILMSRWVLPYGTAVRCREQESKR